MNNITVVGRVGREPETASTANGTLILKFPVADSKKVKGVESTTWYECVMFGARAESLQQYIRKGDQIAVSGSHELQTWDKQEGGKGFKCVISVSDVGLIGGQQSAQQPKPQQQYSQPQQGFNNPPPPLQQPAPDQFDDIPW